MTYYFEYCFCIQDKIIWLSAMWKQVCYLNVFPITSEKLFPKFYVSILAITPTPSTIYILISKLKIILFNSSWFASIIGHCFFMMTLKLLTTPSDKLNVPQCFEDCGSSYNPCQVSSYNPCSKCYVLHCQSVGNFLILWCFDAKIQLLDTYMKENIH